jgi:hypothetical protein
MDTSADREVKSSEKEKTCFVIQPFDSGKFDKRYDDIFKVAIQAAGYKPERVDRANYHVDVIIDAIKKGIENAAVCLVEITTDNANVWYEAGFSDAIGKDLVFVCEKRRVIPFDIGHRKIILYETDSIGDFQNLMQNIRNTLTLIKYKGFEFLDKDSKANINNREENGILKTAKEYFESKTIGDCSLKMAIPELLKVIDDLCPLRESEQRTEGYIDSWRKTKFKQSYNRIYPSGEIIEIFVNNPDMTTHDRFVNWLFDYFHQLYKEKTGKTISYAYALGALTVYHNHQILNTRFRGELIDEPNTNIDDIRECINNEINGN